MTELLSLMLETHFETKYPDHPEFGALMGASETNNLISGLYGGSETPGFEDLVQNFAVPLGLVRNVEGRFEPNSFEQLVQLPYIANLMKLVESSGNATIDLVKAGETLSSEPFGLVREAQRLALTALVSARKLDFVTSKGDRINRRSLDLRIIWDDIVGIARSVERSLTNDRVNEWASRIAVGETFKALSAKEDATRFRKSLEKWYGEWRRERIIDRFELLADEVFNTRIWRIGSAAAKTFNAYADVVSQTIEGDVNPEECVVRIAAIFSDSDEEYARRTSELETIRHFVKGSEIRSRILSYTSLAQYTSDPVIEALRIKTIEAAELCIGDAARDWAKPGTALWTEPYRDPDRQRLMLATVAMPFFRDGVFAGLASIDVRLDELKAVVADSNPRNAWIGILSRQGAMVSWPEQDLHPGETYTSLAERTNRPGIAEIGRHMVNGDSGTAELPDLADPDEQLIVAFTPIPSSGWSLAIAVAQRDVIGPAYAALRERALSSAAILAVVVLIILLLGVWITRPITTLAQSVQALERSGNLEAPLVRVRTADEIGELSKSFNRMVRQLKLRVAELTDATRQREAVLSELRVAREIQTALLPALDPAITTTPDYDLFALNAPARAVAGDFYDFFHLPDARLAIVIADVAGKAVPASIFMAVSRTVIRDLASRGEPPGRVLTEANARLLSDNRSGLFVTVFVAYLNTTSGEIRT
ncbi:SpoIIE family protein phosphatase [Leptolyngbya sp. 15MV]|nr:SpoIIE family protein phosphatase [Leptolyngbya sp. 15MV]